MNIGVGHHGGVDFQRGDGNSTAQDYIFDTTRDGHKTIFVQNAKIANTGSFGPPERRSVFPNSVSCYACGCGLRSPDRDFALFAAGADAAV